MINSLQAGRFLAAMLVVIHHASLSISVFVQEVPAHLLHIFRHGYLGVDFFFVLSGFIIHYSMQHVPRSFLDFVYNRFTRIMLPYWPVGIGIALAYVLLPSLSAGDRDWGWLTTTTLIPTEHPPALNIAWTLQHELVFYALYVIFFATGRLYLGLALWAVCILIANVWVFPDNAFLKVLLSRFNAEFIMGVVVAVLYLSKMKFRPYLSAAIFLIFALVFFNVLNSKDHSWVLGISLSALVYLLCGMERLDRVRIPNWLVFGGAASYAIYLVHDPLLSLTSRGLGALETGWLFGLALSLAISFAAGAAYFLLWEMPVMKLARKLRSGF